jgi:hypothetical protein
MIDQRLVQKAKHITEAAELLLMHIGAESREQTLRGVLTDITSKANVVLEHIESE